MKPTSKNPAVFLSIPIAAILVIFVLWTIATRPIAATDDDRFFTIVMSSQSFKALQERVKKPVAMKDADDGRFVIFNIGEDFPDPFVRSATLRIDKETGKVSKECVDDKLELYWLQE